MRILVVEDDQVIGENLKLQLTSEGYAVDLSVTAEEALDRLLTGEYDCAVIDRGLPDGDGLEVVAQARKDNIGTPVIVLTAYTKPKEKVAGLDSGADDYLDKPFDNKELLARIRALIRRGSRQAMLPKLTVGALVVDTNNHQVTVNNNLIELAPKEYALLEYLAFHPNQAIDRMSLITHAWDENADLFSNTVDVHIRYLRKKLGKEAKLIKTVMGKGYMLCRD